MTTTELNWDISDLRKMATDNYYAKRSDVWGPPAGGMFGNYPNPQTRGTTPWSTTNAEYGRWMRDRCRTGQSQGDGHGDLDGECREGGQGHQEWEQIQGTDDTEAHPGGYNTGSAAGDRASGGQQRDGPQPRAKAKIPSANNTRYLIASRPMHSYDAQNEEHDAAVQARNELKTGAGKRFMVQECTRLWENMKSISSQGEDQPKYSWEADTQVLKIGNEGQGDSYDCYNQSDFQNYDFGGDTQQQEDWKY